jgi:DNA end-binding protein Ku
MRSFLNTEISFGLITIPIKVYSAGKDYTAQFNHIHTKCSTKINNMRYCACCEEIDVPFSDISKGYEIEKGKYAIFTPEELKTLDGENSACGVEILEFVDKQVEPYYLEKNYWLGPNMKGAPKSYVLLCQILKDSNKTAICKVRLRSKTRLAVLRESNGRLLMSTMKFANEVVASDEVVVQDVKINSESKEWKLAQMLVESMSTAELKLDKYVDTFKNAVLESAHAKLSALPGEPAVQQPANEKLIDLADLLEQSLKSQKESQKAG